MVPPVPELVHASAAQAPTRMMMRNFCGTLGMMRIETSSRLGRSTPVSGPRCVHPHERTRRHPLRAVAAGRPPDTLRPHLHLARRGGQPHSWGIRRREEVRRHPLSELPRAGGVHRVPAGGRQRGVPPRLAVGLQTASATCCCRAQAAAGHSAARCCSAACNSRAGCSDPRDRAHDRAPSRLESSAEACRQT